MKLKIKPLISFGLIFLLGIIIGALSTERVFMGMVKTSSSNDLLELLEVAGNYTLLDELKRSGYENNN